MAIRRTTLLTLALCVLVVAQAAPCLAGQAAKAGDGFDPSKVETLGVTVREVVTVPPSSRSGYIGPGVTLMVQHQQEVLKVPLGSKWYYTQQRLPLAVGDEISITGMRPKPNGKVFLAAEIRKEQRSATFRDRDGKPCWQRMKVIEAPPEVSPPPQPSGN